MTHAASGYSTICVSTYDADLAALDTTVDDLKRRGFRRASRSSVIRAALRGYDAARYDRTSEGPVTDGDRAVGAGAESGRL